MNALSLITLFVFFVHNFNLHSTFVFDKDNFSGVMEVLKDSSESDSVCFSFIDTKHAGKKKDCVRLENAAERINDIKNIKFVLHKGQSLSFSDLEISARTFVVVPCSDECECKSESISQSASDCDEPTGSFVSLTNVEFKVDFLHIECSLSCQGRIKFGHNQISASQLVLLNTPPDYTYYLSFNGELSCYPGLIDLEIDSFFSRKYERIYREETFSYLLHNPQYLIDNSTCGYIAVPPIIKNDANIVFDDLILRL